MCLETLQARLLRTADTPDRCVDHTLNGKVFEDRDTRLAMTLCIQRARVLGQQQHNPVAGSWGLHMDSMLHLLRTSSIPGIIGEELSLSVQ